MPRKPELRRSRSWKDLSSFMSKKLWTNDANVPEVPLHRSLSVGRGQRRNQVRKSKMFHDFDVIQHEETIPPTIVERRPTNEQRTLQKRASTRRKAATATKRSSTTFKQQQALASQLPGFAFSPKATGPKARHSRSHSRNMSASTAHSRKASEVSVPLVLDFDIAHSHDSGTPTNGFDFGFISSPIIDRDLTAEEKATLVNNAAPMHIVQIPSRKPTKQNSLKRLFSLRKSNSDKGSPSTSKRNSPQELAVTAERSIYMRPPAVGRQRPLSPPSSPGRDTLPPRLTVQIPDSTFERASKIFQSIYTAHASAQESYTSKEQWGIPTPVSASAPVTRAVINGDEIKHIMNAPEDVSLSFNAEGRTVPKVKAKWSLMPNVEMMGKSDRLWGNNEGCRRLSCESRAPSLRNVKESERPAANNATPTTTTPPLAKAQVPVHVPVTGTRGRISAFPIPITKIVPLTIYESTDEYTSSEEEDFKDSDDEWDDLETSYHRASGGVFKEPAWEMLTPANRSRQ